MQLTREQLIEIYAMSEITCEQCNNYTGTRDFFSSVCKVTGEEIEDGGMVCNCGAFVEYEES
jgi:hypothetical protein